MQPEIARALLSAVALFGELHFILAQSTSLKIDEAAAEDLEYVKHSLTAKCLLFNCIRAFTLMLISFSNFNEHLTASEGKLN